VENPEEIIREGEKKDVGKGKGRNGGNAKRR
jgi:hypothetical protein